MGTSNKRHKLILAWHLYLTLVIALSAVLNPFYNLPHLNAADVNINANVPEQGGGGPALEACRDGNDNDGDGLIDYPLDPGCSFPQDTNEADPPPPPPVACGDGIDNDGDGLIDYPNDPGCTSTSDSDETDPVTSPQCSDGIDNDGDGLIDYPNDPGCSSAGDDDETDVTTQCADTVDNDGDGLIDYPDDPGCVSLTDNDETDPITQCNNGLDDDGDGLIDYPDDPGCNSVSDDDETDPSEPPECSDTLDNDADGLIDYPNDPGCSSASDTDETDALPECSDGTDNDGDGLVDYPADPGCNSSVDNDEVDPITQCNNGLDDDGDSLVDFPNDPGCSTLFDNNELDPTQCTDTVDNDGDGLIDFPNDPGCSSPADDDETSPIQSQCSDGIDNDGDGIVDYPNDPGCTDASDNDEVDPLVLPQCSDGNDNDGDGLIDFPNDPGCTDASDNDEVDPLVLPQCSDGNDNDGDGLIDYPNDPGCESFGDTDETDPIVLPQCSDGNDNDGDGLIDYPNDPGCIATSDNDELNAIVPPLLGEPTDCSDGNDNDGDGFIDYPSDPGCRDIYDNSETDIVEDIIKADLVGVVQELVDISESALLDVAGDLAKPVVRFVNDPQVETTTERIVTPAAAVTTVAVVSSSFSLVQLLSFLQYIFTQPFIILDPRRRKKWGIVYNSITKQPIDLAIVRLLRQADKKLFRSRVTDKAGRYNFLVPPGAYSIQVVKPSFAFPTQVLKGKTEDFKFLDLYHGEPISVTEEDTLIAANIPLDPDQKMVPDKKVIRAHYLRKLQKYVAFASIPLAFIFLIIIPSLVTLGTFSLHVIMYLLFRRLAYRKKPKSWGIVYDTATRKVLPRSVVRIYDKEYNKLLETQMADRRGRYSFLVQDNVYYLTSEKPGYSRYHSPDINLVDKKADLVVGRDVPMEKAKAARQAKPTAAPTEVTREVLEKYVKPEPEVKPDAPAEPTLPQTPSAPPTKSETKSTIAEQVEAERRKRFQQEHSDLKQPPLSAEFDLESELAKLPDEKSGSSGSDYQQLDEGNKKE